MSDDLVLVIYIFICSYVGWVWEIFLYWHIPLIRNGLWVWSSCERLTSMISYMVWFWCYYGFLVGILWRISYLHNLHLEVCVEGHDIGYDLHSFSLVLIIFMDVWVHLHWIWDCDHWFVIIYVMWEMTWFFFYLFPLLVVENLGEHWGLVMRFFLIGH